MNSPVSAWATACSSARPSSLDFEQNGMASKTTEHFELDWYAWQWKSEFMSSQYILICGWVEWASTRIQSSSSINQSIHEPGFFRVCSSVWWGCVDSMVFLGLPSIPMYVSESMDPQVSLWIPEPRCIFWNLFMYSVDSMASPCIVDYQCLKNPRRSQEVRTNLQEIHGFLRIHWVSMASHRYTGFYTIPKHILKTAPTDTPNHQTWIFKIIRIPTSADSLFLQPISYQMLLFGAPNFQIQFPRSST